MRKRRFRRNIKRYIANGLIVVMLWGLLDVPLVVYCCSKNNEPIEDAEELVDICEEVIPEVTEITYVEPDIVEVAEESPTLSEEDLYLLARIAMAEAEGESEEGQRLVMDVVLNRVDNESFPNSVHDVIYESGQFSPINNGRFDRCVPTDRLIELATEESINRTDYDVLYFSGDNYNGPRPLYKVQNHYFSGQ